MEPLFNRIILGSILFVFLLLSCLSKPQSVVSIKPAVNASLQEALNLIQSNSKENNQKGIQLLAEIRKQSSDSTLQTQSQFLLGYGYHALERWPYAELHLQDVSKIDPSLRDYALYLLADAQLNQGLYQEAITSWETLIETEPDSRFIHEAKNSRAQTLLLIQDYSGALDAYHELRRPKSTVLLGKALALEGQGKDKSAKRNFRRILYRDCGEETLKKSLWGLYRIQNLSPPEQPWTYSSLKQLLNTNELHNLAVRSYRCDLHQESLGIYQGLLGVDSEKININQLSPTHLRHYFNMGRNLYSLRRYEEALFVFGRLVQRAQINNHRLPGLYADSLFWAAEAAARIDLNPKARSHYEEFLNKFPRDRRKDEASYRLSLLHYFEKDYLNAATSFASFYEKYPRSKTALDARWYQGWCYYRAKNYPDAIQAWTTLLYQKRNNIDHGDRVHYWIARSWENMGQIEKAIKTYKDLIGKNAYQYYVYAALSRIHHLTQDHPFTHPLPKDYLIDQSGKEVPHLELGDPYSEKSPYNSYWKKSVELNRLGFQKWASHEIYRIQLRTRGSQSLKELALLYRGLNDFRKSSYIAIVHFDPTLTHLFPENPSEDSLKDRYEIWTMAYPRAWSETVQTSALKYQIPQNMIWAIMRQESNFRPEAVSSANATGVMQILPKTAAQMAGIPEEEMTRTLLFQPSFNINLGTKYLRFLADQFQNQPYLMAAGYNAGPDRVNQWIKDNPELNVDEFIEEIPFRETRNYVKRVLRIYANYHALYHPDQEEPLIFDPLYYSVSNK